MMCPLFIICLAMALLVLLGGLFLLGYAKKEGLGRMTKIASYVAILFGTVVFVGGIICATMCHSCGDKGNCKGRKCKSEMSSECHGKMKCEKGGEMNGHGACCSKDMNKCENGMSTTEHCSSVEIKCSKSDSGCCKTGVCTNKDKDCCKAVKTEEVKTVIKTEITKTK